MPGLRPPFPSATARGWRSSTWPRVGGSASGDATARLIAGGEVGPLDVSQMTSYDQIFDDLKLQQWNSVDGEPYGDIAERRGRNEGTHEARSVNLAREEGR